MTLYDEWIPNNLIEPDNSSSFSSLAVESSIEEIKFYEPAQYLVRRTNFSAFTMKKILIVDDQSFNINAVT